MPQRTDPLHAVDIFSGCGGLTLGLKRGGFAVVSAVEIEPHSFSTYKTNHPEVRAFKQDVQTIAGSDLIEGIPKGRSLDLLAGCPPCQGFSSLTSQWRREDARNQLVDEMRRLVRETQPRAVMMENVPGLALKGSEIFQRFVRSLRAQGYRPTWDVLQVADYGVPQLRRRLVLLAGRGFEIPLPKPTHSETGSDGLARWKTLREAIRGLPAPVTLATAAKLGGPREANWHVIRQLSEPNQRRLRHARPGRSWTAIPKRLRPPCHAKKTAGFSNVYGRLRWGEPSVTITGGCTTLSKGRFGHPQAMRTLSVREAALLQTFPIDYDFDCDFMDTVCNMIGNALPCDFAEVVARQCSDALRTS